MEKFLEKDIKIGDIVKIVNTLTGTRYHDNMTQAQGKYMKVNYVQYSSNDWYSGGGYIKGAGYPVNAPCFSDWTWYPEFIDHICTEEEIKNIDEEFEKDHTIDGVKYHKCDKCGEYTSNPTIHEGVTYCSNCVHSHLTICKYCGDIQLKVLSPHSKLNYRQHICDNCVQEHEEEIFWCDYHQRYEEKDSYYPVCTPDGEMWCEDSYNDTFFVCDRCGDVVNRDYMYYDEDTDYCYCEDCWEEKMGDECYTRVCDYHTRVKQKFGRAVDGKIVYDEYAPDFKGYGIELEVDTADTELRDDKDDIVTDISNMTNRAFYYQEDGSLSDDGIEIISHPHTKEALDLLPLEDMCKMLISNGLRSDQAGHCGLHIHISRKLFGDTEAEQDNHILKMVQFYHHFWDDVVKFSRRTNFGYCSKLPCTTEDQLKAFVDKKGEGYGRYTAINLTNRRADTVEVRIMKGTLNIRTLRATLDFVDHIAKRSLTISEQDIENADKWLEGISDRCKEYMKIRGCFGYTLDTLNEEV